MTQWLEHSIEGTEAVARNGNGWAAVVENNSGDISEFDNCGTTTVCGHG